MTKGKFEQPSDAQIKAAMERSRQLRSDAIAEMGSSFWARMFGGAPKRSHLPGKTADC